MTCALENMVCFQISATALPAICQKPVREVWWSSGEILAEFWQNLGGSAILNLPRFAFLWHLFDSSHPLACKCFSLSLAQLCAQKFHQHLSKDANDATRILRQKAGLVAKEVTSLVGQGTMRNLGSKHFII